MSEALDFLVDLLDLESIEVNIFRGVSPNEERQRVFGGQVAAQSLMAAGRTVEIGRPHSLHAYFLRPGDPSVPILYEVDRIRDGRSFTTRRVVAIQHGRAIFHLSASFHRRRARADPPVPHARRARPRDPRLPGHQAGALPGEPSVTGSPSPTPSTSAISGSSRSATTPARNPSRDSGSGPTARCPTIPLLHACIATYASDMSLFDTMLAPHDVSWDDADFMGASLDHCMWFHRPFRADEWLLYDMDSPAAYRRPWTGPGLPLHPGRATWPSPWSRRA